MSVLRAWTLAWLTFIASFLIITSIQHHYDHHHQHAPRIEYDRIA